MFMMEMKLRTTGSLSTVGLPAGRTISRSCENSSRQMSRGSHSKAGLKVELPSFQKLFFKC